MIPTGADHHTGENISEILISIIEEVGPKKVVAIVTDNAANMKLAWKLVVLKYPHITCYGCLLHGLHLFFKDICSQIPVIGEIKNFASDITKEVKSSQILLAIFNEKQKEVKEAAKKPGSTIQQPALQLPGKTRFGSVFFCLSSVLINRSALRLLCVESRAESILSPSFKSVVLHTNFWDILKECVMLLKPLISWLHIVESDEPRISLACSAFFEIRQNIQKTLEYSYLSQENEKLNQILEDRYEFCIKPVHYAANLLDPSKRGSDLIPDELVEAQEYLVNLTKFYSDSEKISAEEVITDCNLFRLKEGIWKKEFLNVTAISMTPYMWWKSCPVGRALRLVALKVLSLPPTSAACERTNSTYKNVHNNATNRLLNERAGKLTFIKQNITFLHLKDKASKSKVEEINSESEFDEIEVSDNESDLEILDTLDEA